MRLVGY